MDEKLIPIDGREKWNSLQVGDTLKVFRATTRRCLGTFTITGREVYAGDLFEVTNEKHESLRYSDPYIFYIVKGD